MLKELSARTDMAEDDLVFYVHMAIELGMLGGIDIGTGLEVHVEHVSEEQLVAMDPAVN